MWHKELQFVRNNLTNHQKLKKQQKNRNMSNLHKDLANDQIHNPKDFSTAANDTFLSKNASGNLEWKSAGTVAGVLQNVAGDGISVDPVGGTGTVTITNTRKNYVSQNLEGYGSIATGTEWGMANAQYNTEHKFVLNLGSPTITTVSPKNAVSGSVWCATRACEPDSWGGWIWGGSGASIALSLLRVKMDCPFPEGVAPATVDVCRIATETIVLAGNNNPKCWNITSFTECGEGWNTKIQPNELIMLTAYVLEGESAAFNMNCNMTFVF